MPFLLRYSRLIDTLNARLGHSLPWLILFAVLVAAGNALVRRIFQLSSNALLEIQWYLFAAVFLLGAGHALLGNAHVRIDILSARLSPRARNWIDVFGIVFFLIPFCLILILMSWPLAVNAWASGEMSQNAGGLVRWPVWLLLPMGFGLLLLQALSELIKRIAFLRGLGGDPLSAHRAQ
ncbi:MAG: sugar transporter [Betaproteobacteria bacterium HGW-Betaproteobacteria-11]|nr:MAG: sugar transporter [Betaproteobacteria bacterium HGW-Betaproteobacteria-11]